MTADEHARMQELEGLVKRYRSRIAALKEEHKAMKWEPIETAPKDGGFFILHNFNGVIAVGYWLIKTAGAPCWWATGYGAFQPTHWMPLPEPP